MIRQMSRFKNTLKCFGIESGLRDRHRFGERNGVSWKRISLSRKRER